jgi:hypothetical protein
MQPQEPRVVDCATECVAGCILGEHCPNLEFKDQASQFIAATSLDEILAIAEAAIQRRRLERASEPPKWVIPDDF